MGQLDSKSDEEEEEEPKSSSPPKPRMIPASVFSVRGKTWEGGRCTLMAPLWHLGTIAPRALKKNETIFWGNPKVNRSLDGVLRA